MKAVVKTENGFDQMVYTDMDDPTCSKNMVKIKIAYSGICGTDIHAFKGTYASTKPPVILGHEFSGIVVEIGSDVKNFKPGDRVTSETTFINCGTCLYCKTKDYNLCSNRQGLGTHQNGSMAEYIISREESVHLLPDNVSLLSASLTEPLACAVHAGIEKGNIQKGDIICIFGAGAIGLMLAQVAKARGAYVVVAGISSDIERLNIAKNNGADLVINQSEENLTDIILQLTKDEGVDIAFECSGAVVAANKAMEIVKKKGKVVQMGVFPEDKEKIATDLILNKEIEYIGSRSQKPSSWEISIQLMEEGTVIPEKIITKIVPLEYWREGIETTLKGEGAKVVLHCNEDLV